MPFSQLKDNIIDFLIAKVAYLVSFSGYFISLKFNFLKMEGLIMTITEAFIKFVFALLLFIVTLGIKHYYDLKNKKIK